MIHRADADYLRRLFVVEEHGGMWTRHHDGFPPAEPDGPAAGVHVMPMVSASRWMVSCPDCGLGQLACPEFPRYYCLGCLNTSVDGHWIEVRWPDPAEVALIEYVLEARPNPETRGWSPGESIGALVAENHMYGNLVDHQREQVMGDPGRQYQQIMPGAQHLIGARRPLELGSA